MWPVSDTHGLIILDEYQPVHLPAPPNSLPRARYSSHYSWLSLSRFCEKGALSTESKVWIIPSCIRRKG